MWNTVNNVVVVVVPIYIYSRTQLHVVTGPGKKTKKKKGLRPVRVGCRRRISRGGGINKNCRFHKDYLKKKEKKRRRWQRFIDRKTSGDDGVGSTIGLWFSLYIDRVHLFGTGSYDRRGWGGVGSKSLGFRERFENIMWITQRASRHAYNDDGKCITIVCAVGAPFIRPAAGDSSRSSYPRPPPPSLPLPRLWSGFAVKIRWLS